jgi:DNA mismatch endonuclease (patch repair protein)
MDIVAPDTRSRMMASVRSKNTKPELLLRKALHSLGYRYRLHQKNLPGKPDLVFPSRRAVVFLNGCFWHGHDCRKAALPTTRHEFWAEKIATNRSRDARDMADLSSLGWRVRVVWECDLRRDGTIEAVTGWLGNPGASRRLPTRAFRAKSKQITGR